jgi:hypothetical protein
MWTSDLAAQHLKAVKIPVPPAKQPNYASVTE